MNNQIKIEKLPKALAFDLDGTLAPSKSHLESDMSSMLSDVLKLFPIAVVSGASKEQFSSQFLKYLPEDSMDLSNLYIFPENGASLEFYKNGKWEVQFEDKFSEEESQKIISALKAAEEKFNLEESWYHILKYGHEIENRGAQITFSALGQKAPLELKEKWDREQIHRKKIKDFIEPLLPECEIRIGGTTSVDITKKGKNKAFAIKTFLDLLKIDKSELIFFGDALYEGGNDEIVRDTGVICKKVSNPQDTIGFLRDIIRLYEETNRQSSLG